MKEGENKRDFMVHFVELKILRRLVSVIEGLAFFSIWTVKVQSTWTKLTFWEQGDISLDPFENFDFDWTRKILYRASYVSLVESSHRSSKEYWNRIYFIYT